MPHASVININESYLANKRQEKYFLPANVFSTYCILSSKKSTFSLNICKATDDNYDMVYCHISHRVHQLHIFKPRFLYRLRADWIDIIIAF